MSELQEIDVFLLPDGTTRVEIRGIKGKSCLDVTRGLEALLGSAILDREYTDELYQQAETARHLSIERRDES